MEEKLTCDKCTDIHKAQKEGKTQEECKCKCHGKLDFPTNPFRTYPDDCCPYIPVDPCCPAIPPYPMWQVFPNQLTCPTYFTFTTTGLPSTCGGVSYG